MPTYAIWFGRILVLIGIIGYGYGMFSGNASLTALIPAAFGLVLMLLGHLAAAKEDIRKHVMHAAVLIGLVGFLIPAWRLFSRAGDLTLSAAVVSQAAMSIACLAFVILAVQSFIAARRSV
jgi:hypothetical protein